MLNHLALAAVPLLCGLLCAADAVGVTLHVATTGDDRNPGTEAAPLATLHQARDILRERSEGEGLPEGATVLVYGGTYEFTEPLVFRPENSGTEEGPIVYRAAPGAEVTLTGSRTVSGWEPFRDGIRQADLSETDLGEGRFRQLHYRGKRQPLARYPNFDPEHPRTGGFLYAGLPVEEGSKTLLRYDPERLDPTRWKDPTQLRLHVWSWLNWNRNILPVEAVDTQNHVITLARPASYKLIEGNRFFVENALEELDAPGEWYFDEATRVLYFMPPDGNEPGEGVTVPVLARLVQFLGASVEDRVGHIELRGFTLAETHSNLVDMRHARHCTVAACVITRCGGTAVSIHGASSHNRILGCDIAHVGGMAVFVNGTRDWQHRPEGQPSHNLISNNHVHDVGEGGDAWGAIMIAPGCGGNATHDNVISHNLVHDTPRQGITFNGFRNIVEFNHVHHTNQEQSDTGAIGMGSRDIYERGSIVRYNFIHDTGGYNMLRPGVWAYPHYCWGVYLDDYTSNVHVHGNIIVRTYLGGVMVHGGKNNLIENNIIVDGHSQQVQYSPIDHLTSGRTAGHPDESMWLMTDTWLVRNIFSYDGEKAGWLRGSKWDQILAGSDDNIIWPRGGSVRINLPEIPDGDYLAAWRAMGFDRGSIIADPLFIDPDNDDYRLRPESPALAMGFEPIPVERIGPYESPDRATWPLPRPDEIWREEHLRHPEGEPGPRIQARDVPRVAARRVQAAPVIDGNIEPPEWAWEGPGVVEVAALSMGSGPGRQPSRAAIARDDRALYVALINRVSDTATLVREGGTWGQDDGAEVCIQDASGDRPGPVFVVQGFPSGKSQSVDHAGAPAQAARQLGEAVQYAARIGDGEWLAEWCIPFAALGVDPERTGRLLFNIGVLKRAESQWIAWVSTGGAPWHMDRAGVLVLD